MPGQVSIDAKPALQWLQIGAEKQPLLVVDDFMPDYQKWLGYAGQTDDYQQEAGDFYPGVRHSLPTAYGNEVLAFFRQASSQSQARLSLCSLSVANAEPDALLPIQRIPHFDCLGTQQWAMVHYLCDEQFGGTGFYRHRQTGYESMDKTRIKRFQRVLDDEACTRGLPPARYLNNDSPLFELTHYVEARPNRAIFYSGNLFHSGHIKQWQCAHPSQGRLTATAFFATE